MMKPKVYIETTVASYLTAWSSRDVVIAGHQQVTRDWWKSGPDRFEFVISALVVQEAAEGDPGAARDRLSALSHLPLIEVTEDALDLSRRLVEAAAVPVKAVEDAQHLSIAATNGNEYLVTWNYRHLANATLRERIEAVCRSCGYDRRSFAHPKNCWRSIPMIDDPIVAEVRKVRDEHAAKFNYDLDAIFRDIKEKEKSIGRRCVRYQPRPTRTTQAAAHSSVV